MKNDKNSIYWAYNLPLQVWPIHENQDEETGPIVGARILNYMPRRERCEVSDLSDFIGEQTREDFFECAALRLENLAKLMRIAAKDETFTVYYPDEGMDKDNPNGT